MVLGEKKIKIQNKADLSRNEASMGAEFLDKSALFCIFIFFCPRTIIIYVCPGFFRCLEKPTQNGGMKPKL